jgi:hypothetical protein
VGCVPKNHLKVFSERDTDCMAKSQERKTSEVRVSPMNLQIGCRPTAVKREREMSHHAVGKTAHVRVRKVSDPPLTELLTWEADEWISVKREEGKR